MKTLSIIEFLVVLIDSYKKYMHAHCLYVLNCPNNYDVALISLVDLSLFKRTEACISDH